MTLVNVSSPFRVRGSDTDLELWLSSTVWAWVTTLLTVLRIGQAVRPTAYRIALGNAELYLINEGDVDVVTLALHSNLAIMRGWDAETKASYVQAKCSLAHLSGLARKQAKAMLAIQYGLNPVVYQGGLSALLFDWSVV